MGGFSRSRLRRMREGLGRYVERGDLPGFVYLLNRHGETQVEVVGKMALGGEAPMARDSIFRIASLSKPIVTAAAMTMVEECLIRLDDPVDRFLPELADRKVLKSPNGPLEDTVPADGPITLRHLLTFTMGLGYLMTPNQPPIMKAANERGLLVGPPHPDAAPEADEWIRRVGELPLMFQPGERWLYDLSMDVLGVLLARAAGKPLDELLRERVLDPLGMPDTAFHVTPERIGRLTESYMGGGVYDRAAGGEWSRPSKFSQAGGGLVSTADDLLAFARMLLARGAPILARPTVEAMTTDQLDPSQREGMDIFFEGNRSWGFGLSVFTRRDAPWAVPGRFGWDGGLGTSMWMDPAEDLTGILLTQQSWDSPKGPEIWNDFWSFAYAAVAD